MNKKNVLIAALFSITTALSQAQELNPTEMMTVWGEEVTPENAWREYPRPQLQRTQWMSLNGTWQCAVQPKEKPQPGTFCQSILVPFAAESTLSGVERVISPSERLWYKRTFTVPENWNGKSVVLRFDAVDWEAEVWLNGKRIGVHRGGNDPFHFDITDYLKKGTQELVVAVWDPTDTGTQARGKQVLDPKGIWYTPVTGIWQSVWLEPLEKTHIDSILPLPDIDRGLVKLQHKVTAMTGDEQLVVKVLDGERVIGEAAVAIHEPLTIAVPQARLWFPHDPKLYKLDIRLYRSGKELDGVTSYFAMRKISIGKDERGYQRLLLNNKPLFQYGTLDQGWWPDGLLTPPSEKAMLYDMEMLKSMGFNMLRKHIKVEPSRYYYYADSLGLLVWQDMVSGFATAERGEQHVAADAPSDWNRPIESAEQYEREWKSIMDHLRFFPSIVVWVPFNEGWGQYETRRVVEWTMDYDPTRVVDGVSGWTDRNVGHMNDAHHYPGPGMEPAVQNPGRAIVLGEFGGLGWPLEGHIWNTKTRNWGYRTYYSEGELVKEYIKLLHNLRPMIGRGLSAAVYTQTTDVEGEVNGLLTYDRKKVKIDPELLRILHESLYRQPECWKALAEDSEVSPQPLRILREKLNEGQLLAIDEARFKSETGPVRFTKDEHGAVMKEFNCSKEYDGVQIRILAHADVRIFLNGKEIVNKFINTKRHYDEINVSEFRDYLVAGKNTLFMEINGSKALSEVDLGLYVKEE